MEPPSFILTIFIEDVDFSRYFELASIRLTHKTSFLSKAVTVYFTQQMNVSYYSFLTDSCCFSSLIALKLGHYPILGCLHTKPTNSISCLLGCNFAAKPAHISSVYFAFKDGEFCSDHLFFHYWVMASKVAFLNTLWGTKFLWSQLNLHGFIKVKSFAKTLHNGN